MQRYHFTFAGRPLARTGRTLRKKVFGASTTQRRNPSIACGSGQAYSAGRDRAKLQSTSIDGRSRSSRTQREGGKMKFESRRAIRCAIGAIILCFLGITWARSQSAAPGTDQKPQMSEEAFKNIQVL